MRGRKKQVLRYALVPSAPRRAPQNRVVRSGRRVGVLPTAARLYFPTLSGESSRQTAALLLGTLPYPRLVSGQHIVFLTDWRGLCEAAERLHAGCCWSPVRWRSSAVR